MLRKNSEKGQGVIEYIFIAIFSIFSSIAALKMGSQLMEQKVSEIASRSDIDISEFQLNPFSDE